MTHKKQWVKYFDWCTGATMYSFEGRIPCITASTIEVSICPDRRKEIPECSDSSYRTYYQASVFNTRTECGWREEFRYLRNAKRATEEMFDEFCRLNPKDAEAW